MCAGSRGGGIGLAVFAKARCQAWFCRGYIIWEGGIYSERGYIFVAVIPHTVYPPCVGVMFAIRSCSWIFWME